MKIELENITLRDMIEADIEDYVRWFTVETAWSDSDTPWEPIETDEETERAAWREYYDFVKDIPDDVRRPKFEIEWNGKHIGWVSSYLIDENYEWLGQPEEGQIFYYAIGIDICESDVWGNGIGTNALRAFMNYLFDGGEDVLYMQTWSGNARMLRCAEKLGFRECDRKVGSREANGQKYDGLTLRLEKAERADSLFKLAIKHIYGDGVPEDNDLAFRLLTQARAMGHVEAAYDLGICHHYGYGTEEDLQKAFDLYWEAAHAGCGKGMELVGRLYNRGICVAKDRQQAEFWLNKALQSDDPEAVEEAKKELLTGGDERCAQGE